MLQEQNHEGDNLREILISRFGSLEKAAQTLDKDYAYLTKQVKQPKLKPKYLLSIAESLGVPPEQIRGESHAPKWASEKEEFEYYRKELEAMNKKYTALLEEHIKLLKSTNKSE